MVSRTPDDILANEYATIFLEEVIGLLALLLWRTTVTGRDLRFYRQSTCDFDKFTSRNNSALACVLLAGREIRDGRRRCEEIVVMRTSSLV